MKSKIAILVILLTASLPTWASLYSSGTLIGGTIPDNNTLGLTESLNLSASGQDVSITAMTLSFTLQDGASTDLSGYLRLGNLSGSPSYDLTSLIHGTAEAAGGTTYLVNFTTATYGSGFQSAFNGQNPNDTWTLFFADTFAGDTTTLTGWSLDITAVPEPVNVALGLFGCVLLAAGSISWYRRIFVKPRFEIIN